MPALPHDAVVVTAVENNQSLNVCPMTMPSHAAVKASRSFRAHATTLNAEGLSVGAQLIRNLDDWKVLDPFDPSEGVLFSLLP